MNVVYLYRDGHCFETFPGLYIIFVHFPYTRPVSRLASGSHRDLGAQRATAGVNVLCQTERLPVHHSALKVCALMSVFACLCVYASGGTVN